MKREFALAVLGAICSASASAFEFSTHAKITEAAVTRFLSLPENTELLKNLGLNFPNTPPFVTKQYFVMEDAGPIPRKGLAFEELKMSGAGLKSGPDTLVGWIARGAVREDDDPGDPTAPRGDDPDGDIHRLLRHFYDPINRTALTIFSKDPCGGYAPLFWDTPAPCATAVDWALGTDQIQRRNHFSIIDAREAMFRALTGYNGSFVPVASDAATRQQYWMTAFRALGDVMHLEQDMAQPQHTRNDPHAGKIFGLPTMGASGHKSTFELFVEASVRGETQLIVPGDTDGIKVPLKPENFVFDGYPGSASVVRFPTYRQYWTVSGSKGLADYTNNGFFTAGTNIGSSGNVYINPSSDTSSYNANIVQATNWEGDPVFKSGAPVNIKLYQGPVPDAYTGSPDNGVNLTAMGSWNQFFSSPQSWRFTLYRENYRDQARLVLPRAVGYSAGLLNHFFRGRLDISLPIEQVYSAIDYKDNHGFSNFKVMVKNTTASILGSDGQSLIPQATASSGKLVAVVRYRRNTCLQYPTLAGAPYMDSLGNIVWSESCRQPSVSDQYLPDILVSDPVDAPQDMESAPQAVLFNFSSPVPFNAIDVELQVVYRGPLGMEPDDLAIGFRRTSDPTFYDFVNLWDCSPPNTVLLHCDIGSTSCPLNAAVKLPLPDNQVSDAQPFIAQISNLLPGQYGRVAYITDLGYRDPGDFTLEVSKNYDLQYDLDITYIPDGSQTVWPKGHILRGWLYRGREVTGGSGGYMYSWASYSGDNNVECDNNVCSEATYANLECKANSTAVDATPQPVQVTFPASPPS